MALLAAITACELVEAWEKETLPLAEVANEGSYVRIDGTTGRFVLGNASSAGEVGGVTGYILVKGAAVIPKTVTGVKKGLVDVGSILDGLPIGTPIYLPDTDQRLADTAGTVSKIVGYVWPVHQGGTLKRLLRVDL